MSRVCYVCNKEKIVYPCEGCLKQFCINDLNEHLRTLSIQVGELENERDQFQEILTQKQNNPKTLPLMQEIDRWEEDSIKKIKETAEECRQILMEHMSGHFIEIEKELFSITEQLKYMRRENEFNEIYIEKLKAKLTQLTQEVAQPGNVRIQQDSTSFINKISVVVSSPIPKEGKFREPTRY